MERQCALPGNWRVNAVRIASTFRRRERCLRRFLHNLYRRGGNSQGSILFGEQFAFVHQIDLIEDFNNGLPLPASLFHIPKGFDGGAIHTSL
jgi:hypothetical protein